MCMCRFIPASALCTKLGFDRDLVISVLSEAGHPEESTVDSTTFVSLLLSLVNILGRNVTRTFTWGVYLMYESWIRGTSAYNLYPL